MLDSTLTGLVTGLSLIIAIGAQNAYVLRQGLAHDHTLLDAHRRGVAADDVLAHLRRLRRSENAADRRSGDTADHGADRAADDGARGGAGCGAGGRSARILRLGSEGKSEKRGDSAGCEMCRTCAAFETVPCSATVTKALKRRRSMVLYMPTVHEKTH